MRATIIFFSPCGSCKARVGEINKALAPPHCVTVVDITKSSHAPMDLDGDLLVIAMPIYNNSLPQCAKEWLESSKLDFKYAVVCLVYGGVSKGNALAECAKILECKNIDLVGGGFFPTRHCYLSKDTCDCNDRDKSALSAMLNKAMCNINNNVTLSIRGNKNATARAKSIDKYRSSWFPPPYTDMAKCTACGKCITVCPAQAIDSNYATSDNCIHCNACVNTCTDNARIFKINKTARFGMNLARLFNKRYKIL